MGNEDGIMSAMANVGTNKVIEFDGGYFSFAMGNEIAFVLDDISGYFILNCDYKLFDKVKALVSAGKTKEELAKFWIEQSKTHTVSDWSAIFTRLEEMK